MKNLSSLRVLFARPLKLAGEAFSRKNLRNLSRRLFSIGDSAEVKAISVALGVFIGILPIWGFQTLAAIFLAVAFRLNKALVLLCSQISFPPLMPLIILLSCRAGGLWFSQPIHHAATTPAAIFSGAGFARYMAGSLTLAPVAAVVTGLLAYLLFISGGFLKRNKLKFAGIYRRAKIRPAFDIPASSPTAGK